MTSSISKFRPHSLISSFILEQELCKRCVFQVLKSDKDFSRTYLSLSVTFNSHTECVFRKETKTSQVREILDSIQIRGRIIAILQF